MGPIEARFSIPSSLKGRQVARFVLEKLNEEWDLTPKGRLQDALSTRVSPPHLLVWYTQSGWLFEQFRTILERFRDSGLIVEFEFYQEGEYFEDEDLGVGTNTWLRLRFSGQFGELYELYKAQLEARVPTPKKHLSLEEQKNPIKIRGRTLSVLDKDITTLTASQTVLLGELLTRMISFEPETVQYEPVLTAKLRRVMKTEDAFRSHLNRLRKATESYNSQTLLEIISTDQGEKKSPAYQVIAHISQFKS